MTPELRDKLSKILALTTSPVEGEASAAAAMLQRLLDKHNLSVADLEAKGQSKPGVREQAHDLGKAAFRWKLDLAEGIATHYYCAPLVSRRNKTVSFVGRPDNVEALTMLYAWLVDQIKRVAAEDRRTHAEETGTHVDPLRWQVNFGVGAVSRLVVRLDELKRQREADVTSQALVISHAAEVSDYLESTYGYRVDGQETAVERERRERWEARERTMAELKERDIEAYYRERPWERPATPEQLEAQRKLDEAATKREEANARRRNKRAEERGYYGRWSSQSAASERRDDEGYAARQAGKRGAERINLEPFLTGRTPAKPIKGR